MAGPFRSSARSPGVWLEARLVAEVSYAELMQGRLRAPVFSGFAHRVGPQLGVVKLFEDTLSP